jgi:hypothetical protein
MKTLPICLIVLLSVLSPVTEVLAQEANETATKDSYSFDQDYHKYFNYEDVQARLEKVHQDHPTITRILDLTAMTEFGATYQGRHIWGVEISKDPTRIDPDKAKVLIVGNVHGDENMGMEICMYTIDYLTDLYGQPPTDNDGDGLVDEDPVDDQDNDWDGLIDEDAPEAQATFLVDTRELFIIPFPNPDGSTYDAVVYAANGGAWRKNMRDNNNNGVFDSNYDGVDLNRNYPYMWNANRYLKVVDQNGVTITQDYGNPSSGQYRGPPDNFDDDGDAKLPAPDYWSQHYGKDWNGIDEDPYNAVDDDGDGKVDEDKDGGFSEPETQSIEMMTNMLDSDGDHTNGKSDIAMSMTYHTYAALVLYPWGYTQDSAPDDALLSEVAHRMGAINGYTAERGPDLYPTSGDSDDYFYGTMGTLAFTIEVANIDGGGFHPKPKYIINQSRENMAINLYMLEVAELAKAAKALKSDTIDIGVPGIVHLQPRTTIAGGKDYQITVDINDTSNLKAESLMLVYRTRPQGGSWGDWQRVELMPKDVEGRFAGSVPGQDGGTVVQYYFVDKDTRGPSCYDPQYGFAAPYSYTVTGYMGLGNFDPVPWVLLIVVLVVVAVLYIRFRKRRVRTVLK